MLRRRELWIRELGSPQPVARVVLDQRRGKVRLVVLDLAYAAVLTPLLDRRPLYRMGGGGCGPDGQCVDVLERIAVSDPRFVECLREALGSRGLLLEG